MLASLAGAKRSVPRNFGGSGFDLAARLPDWRGISASLPLYRPRCPNRTSLAGKCVKPAGPQRLGQFLTSLTTSRSGLLGEGAKSLPRTFRSIGHQSKAHQASKGLVSACQSSCRNSQWRSFYTYSSHPELHPKIDVFYCTMSTSARQPPEELQARVHRLCFVHYTRDLPFRRCDR